MFHRAILNIISRLTTPSKSRAKARSSYVSDDRESETPMSEGGCNDCCAGSGDRESDDGKSFVLDRCGAMRTREGHKASAGGKPEVLTLASNVSFSGKAIGASPGNVSLAEKATNS